MKSESKTLKARQICEEKRKRVRRVVAAVKLETVKVQRLIIH